MVNYPEFSFASAPRSGSTYFMQAAANAGLGVGHKASVHIPDERDSVFKIAMVRHPCDWLASYFNVIKGGIIGVKSVDLFSQMSTDWVYFDEFVENYLNKASGCVGRMFLSYNANTYLRIEDTPRCFFELCDTFCIKHPEMPDRPNAKLRDFCWDESLYQSVVEAESEFIDKFNYDIDYTGAKR